MINMFIVESDPPKNDGSRAYPRAQHWTSSEANKLENINNYKTTHSLSPRMSP